MCLPQDLGVRQLAIRALFLTYAMGENRAIEPFGVSSPISRRRYDEVRPLFRRGRPVARITR